MNRFTTFEPPTLAVAQEVDYLIENFHKPFDMGGGNIKVEILVVVVVYGSRTYIGPVSISSFLKKQHSNLGAQLPTFTACKTLNEHSEKVMTRVAGNFGLTSIFQDKLREASWPSITLFLSVEWKARLEANEQVPSFVRRGCRNFNDKEVRVQK